MNYIALGITGSIIIAGIIVLSLISLMWLKKKETVLKKKVKTVEELYPGVPFKQVVYKPEKPIELKPGETIYLNVHMKDDINKITLSGKEQRNHVNHPYKRKRKK